MSIDDSKYPVFKNYRKTPCPGAGLHWIEAVGDINTEESYSLDSSTKQSNLVSSFAKIKDENDVLSWITKHGLPALDEPVGLPKPSRNQLEGIAGAADNIRKLLPVLNAIKDKDLEKLAQLAVYRMDRNAKKVIINFPEVSHAYYDSGGLFYTASYRMIEGQSFPVTLWEANKDECRFAAALLWIVDATNIMLSSVGTRIVLRSTPDEPAFVSVLKPRCPWQAIAVWFERQISSLPLRRCQICHKPFDTKKRPQAKTCTGACRTAKSRKGES